MRMPGSSEAQRSRIRDEETFMSGALAGPGLSRSRLRCHGRIAAHTAAAPTHSTAPPKSIPTPEENS